MYCLLTSRSIANRVIKLINRDDLPKNKKKPSKKDNNSSRNDSTATINQYSSSIITLRCCLN